MTGQQQISLCVIECLDIGNWGCTDVVPPLSVSADSSCGSDKARSLPQIKNLMCS